MNGSAALPAYASAGILLACALVAYYIVRLAGSQRYHRRVPAALKILLAMVASQAAFVFFLPLMRLMNFLPALLTGTAALYASYLGEALGVVWSIPCGVTICYALLPRTVGGTWFGVLSYLIMNVMTVLYIVGAGQNGQYLTLLFYACSILFGLGAFLLALLRRRPKKRVK